MIFSDKTNLIMIGCFDKDRKQNIDKQKASQE